MDTKTSFAQGQLKSLVERIERLEEEKKVIAGDIKEIYAEAKANGFDYVSHPVEGFSGFNPALADGRYTVSLETILVEGYKVLYVKVTKD